jgi:hypothetical protein
MNFFQPNYRQGQIQQNTQQQLEDQNYAVLTFMMLLSTF